MELTDKQREAFWAKVDRRGPDECWLWIGSTDGGRPGYAYGTFQSRPATHAALAIDGRERQSPEMHARHSCDNKLCVNPHHLKWGTRWDNVVDALERGNMKRLLTDEQAASIRADPRSQSEIARAYGVTQSVIRQIKIGYTYTHEMADAVLR